MLNPARTITIKRYGSEMPLPGRRSLRAGPVHALLEGGDLRYVRLGDHEIVRRLYVAIRDRNWNTVPPIFTTYEADIRSDSFRIELEVEHVSADADFAWSGSIEGRPDGTIVYALTGAPRKRFLRNRIGFCVLHPSDLAGVPAITTTLEGSVGHPFPDLISPHQPFIDMTAISYSIGPTATATISFEGDLFEMEDQRNWTDASYKTYSTPLRLPYPVEVGPDDLVSQTVTISVSGTAASKQAAAPSAPDVTVALDSLSPLPAIGFGAGMGGTISIEDMNRLRTLHPAHLWVSIDLTKSDWREDLAEATDRAEGLETSLDLSVIAGSENDWPLLAAAVQARPIPVGRVFAFPAVDNPIVFPRFDLATDPKTIAAAHRAFASAGIDAILGGGSRAYFTELNRASDFLPVDALDTVTYTITPTVHATDNLSVVETLQAQGKTVSSARALIGDRELAVGPVTLQPPYNPNATGPAPGTPPDALPATVDSRQLSLFGAGWTLGSIRELSRAGANAMTFYELYGWRGLIERHRDLTRRELFPSQPGQLFPLYHVFAAVADFRGGSIADITIADPFVVEALALRKEDRVRLMIGSFAEESTSIALSVPGLSDATVAYLDETTYDDSIDEPDFFRRQSAQKLDITGGRTSVELLPFAVARIDGRAG